jgi:DEAD/DEAH box helicase domain-containing protein
VDSSNLGSPTLFLYDRYLGGLGFAEKGYELFGALMHQCLITIEDCPCEDGCPSCVGLPATQPAQQMDPDLGRGYPIPDKQAALFILRHLRGRDSSSTTPRVDALEAAPLEGRRPEAKAPPALSTAEQVAHRLRRRRRPRIGL